MCSLTNKCEKVHVECFVDDNLPEGNGYPGRINHIEWIKNQGNELAKDYTIDRPLDLLIGVDNYYKIHPMF